MVSCNPPRMAVWSISQHCHRYHTLSSISHVIKMGWGGAKLISQHGHRNHNRNHRHRNLSAVVVVFNRAWAALHRDDVNDCIKAAVVVFNARCCKFATRFDIDTGEEAPRPPPCSACASTAVSDEDHDSFAVRWAQSGAYVW